MATNRPILPLNQRYVNGVPLPVSGGRVALRTTEKYVLFLIGLVFISLCYSAMFLLPDRVNSFVDSPQDLFKPRPLDLVDGVGGIDTHDDADHEAHKRDDQMKLELLIQQEKALENARNAINPLGKDADRNRDAANDDNRPRSNEAAGANAGAVSEEHHEIKQEVQRDKEEFLKKQKEEEEKRKEENRDNAKKKSDPTDGFDEADGDPSDSQTKTRRNKIREVYRIAMCCSSNPVRVSDSA